jgi:hypothetical protein
VATGWRFTIAAGDSYFEISKNLEIFNELYKELNIYYVDDTQPGTDEDGHRRDAGDSWTRTPSTSRRATWRTTAS